MENDRTFRFFPHSLSEPLVGRHASVILCGRFGTWKKENGTGRVRGREKFLKKDREREGRQRAKAEIT